MKQCEVCENALSIDDRYCSKCGAEQPVKVSVVENEDEIVETSSTTCPNCDTKLKKNDIFCTSCGVKVTE